MNAEALARLLRVYVRANSSMRPVPPEIEAEARAALVRELLP
jgi:hypothetical protein